MKEKFEKVTYSEIDSDKEKVEKTLLKVEDFLVGINDLIKNTEVEVEKFTEALKILLIGLKNKNY